VLGAFFVLIRMFPVEALTGTADSIADASSNTKITEIFLDILRISFTFPKSVLKKSSI